MKVPRTRRFAHCQCNKPTLYVRAAEMRTSLDKGFDYVLVSLSSRLHGVIRDGLWGSSWSQLT